MKSGFSLPSGGARGLLYTKTNYLFWLLALLVNTKQKTKSDFVNSTPL